MVKLDWNELQDQAGSNTYIRPDTSTRLYTNGDDIAGTENELVDFPKIMKELQNVGLTVLRWDRDERSFKRACIKVDDKLQGLYILDQEQKLIKELAIRDLNRVAHDAEAVKLFQQHQATDPHMDAKTCFFLIHSNWDGQPNADLGHDVPADHAELIMAAPGQQLKMKIEAIMAAAPSPSEYSEANKDISARKIQSYSRYSALRKATKTAGRVLTDTVLLDAHGIFLKGTKTIDLQLLFNNQTKEVVKMPVSELDTRGCEQAGAMAAKNHNLNGADSARLGFAFQECHCMRQICVHLAPTVFPVYRFSATSPITHTLANDSAMAASSAELQKALKDMESQAPSKSSCALMKALQQTLDLEVDYQDAVNKAKQFKNVDLDAVLRQHLDESNLGPEYTGDIYLEVPLGGAPPTPKQKQNGQGGSISGSSAPIPPPTAAAPAAAAAVEPRDSNNSISIDKGHSWASGDDEGRQSNERMGCFKGRSGSSSPVRAGHIKVYIKGVLRKKPVVMEFRQDVTVRQILQTLADKHGTPRGVLVGPGNNHFDEDKNLKFYGFTEQVAVTYQELLPDSDDSETSDEEDNMGIPMALRPSGKKDKNGCCGQKYDPCQSIARECTFM